MRMLDIQYRHNSQRGYFAYDLYNLMATDPNVWVLTGDLGWGMMDYIKRDFPTRFINCGSAEHTMVGIAVGLALEGKIPLVYSITPFLLYRAFEQIRNYVDHENIAVKLIGAGRFQDYEHDGFSHYAGDDKRFMRNFKNIICLWPENYEDIDLKDLLYNNRAVYLNLRR